MEQTKIDAVSELCCGCGGCAGVCPADAIEMHMNERGFRYPVIDPERCIGCERCRKVCPFFNYDKINSRKTTSCKQKCFAVKHCVPEKLNESQSGGMFTAISDYVLERRGVVYGVVMDEDYQVIHRRAETARERNEMRKSKYVFSRIDESVWEELDKDIRQRRIVLFTGSPCQCSSVRNRYSKEKNLIICDIVCHGGSSPVIWKDYIESRIRESSVPIEKYIFRDSRKFGWHDNRETIRYSDGREKSGRGYASLFYSDCCFNDVCYVCPFSRPSRVGDITMGDFWGVEKLLPGYVNDYTGVSLVLLNTEKGHDIFCKISGSLMAEDCTDLEWNQQYNLQYPTPMPGDREQFWNDYLANGFRYAAEHYGVYSWRKICVTRFKAILRKMSAVLRYPEVKDVT